MPEQPKLSPKAQAMTKDLAKLPGRIDTYFKSYIDNNKSMPPKDRALAKYEAILSVVDLGSDLIKQSFTDEQKQELYASLTELKDESLKISPRSKHKGIKSMLAQLQNKLDKPADKPFTPEEIDALKKEGVNTLGEITERINTVKNEAIEVKKSLTSYKVKKNLSSSKLGKLGKKTIRELNDIKTTMRGHRPTPKTLRSALEGNAASTTTPLPPRRPSTQKSNSR